MDNHSISHSPGTFKAVIFSILINTRDRLLLPRFEALMMALNFISFFAILIPMVVLSFHQTSSDIFNNFLSYGNLRTPGFPFIIGTIGNLFGFCGADGAIHISEKIGNTSVVVPRAITANYVVNGAVAFSMLSDTLFCMGDIGAALSSPTGILSKRSYKLRQAQTQGYDTSRDRYCYHSRHCLPILHVVCLAPAIVFFTRPRCP